MRLNSTTSLFVKTIPGILLMFAVAVLAKGGEDFGFHWRGLEDFFGANPVTKTVLIDAFRLNYVLLSILIGMLIGNLIILPGWLLAGISTSRLFIKSGVILLGSLYSFADVASLGGTAILLVLTFVVLTLIFTLWLGSKLGMDPASAAVLSAGTSVCGVSAIVATAPRRSRIDRARHPAEFSFSQILIKFYSHTT